MEIQFLGTGAGLPSKQRNVTSIALKLLDENNEIWLFDCGEGTQHQILYTTIRPRKIKKIFITHLHGDHIFGLPGLLSSRSFQGVESELKIIGPKGIKDFVLTSLRISESKLSYPLTFIELDPEGGVLEYGSFKVHYLPLDHRIQSFGYRIEEADHKGELQVNRLKEMGIPPGPLYKKIKDGGNIVLEDGRKIRGSDFVGERVPGRIITILGDTRSHSNVHKLALDADVLVHESTFNAQESHIAREYYHSTTAQAAQTAKDARVKKLLLTHISARYLGKAAKDLEREAQHIFSATQVMNDLDSIDLPLKKKVEGYQNEK